MSLGGPIKNLILALFLLQFSVAGFSAESGLGLGLKSFFGLVKDAGQIDTKANCSSCIQPADQKFGTLQSTGNETIKVSVLTEEELNKYFNELKNSEILFSYYYDGCYARAHKISMLLEEKGIITGKAIVEGDLAVLFKGYSLRWNYHVAPVVIVEKDGKQIPYIIDPSLFKKPVPYEEWLTAFSDNKFRRIKAQRFLTRFSLSLLDVDNSKISYTWLDNKRMNDFFKEVAGAVKNNPGYYPSNQDYVAPF